jgi:hypothetical protein
MAQNATLRIIGGGWGIGNDFAHVRKVVVPPRGLGDSSCKGDEPVRPEFTGTWLELVTAPPSQVWTDRAREIRKLREQGETLARIGQWFGLSAERVRQILFGASS